MSLDIVRAFEIQRDTGVMLANRLAEVLLYLSEFDDERSHYWKNQGRLAEMTSKNIEERFNYLIDRELRRQV